MSLTLTVGPAVDKILTLAQSACTANPLTVVGETVTPVAVDGQPLSLEPAMFIVGLDNPPPEVSGTTQWSGTAPLLGGPSAAEDYQIPCCIDVRLPVPDQKTVRDFAGAIFNSFWDALMADRSLGGVLAGGGAVVVNVGLTPGRVGTAAEPGQRHLLTFAVRCTDLQLG